MQYNGYSQGALGLSHSVRLSGFECIDLFGPAFIRYALHGTFLFPPQAQMQSEAREAAEGRTDKVEMLVTESEIVVTQLYKLGKTPKQMIQTFDIAAVVYASPVRLELQPPPLPLVHTL